jgi:ribosomal protein L37AE/L43A
MHIKYVHYFGNESTESLLEAYGLVDHGIQINQLNPKQCPNCSEPNKPDSKFCAKCCMVLSYDSYAEVIQQQEAEKSKMERLEEEVAKLSAVFDKFT